MRWLDTDAKRKSGGMATKIFLVVIRRFSASGPGEEHILAAKMSLTAAKSIEDKVPGSYIVRVLADKSVPDDRTLRRMMARATSSKEENTDGRSCPSDQ